MAIRPSTIAKHIGRRFGRLTVLEFDHQVGRSEYFFRCRCDCGTEKIIRIGGMQQGTSQSCGCLGKEIRAKANSGNTRVRKLFGESAFNNLMGAYRIYARDRSHPFELTADQFRQITSSNCFYCGCPPAHEKKMRNGYGTYFYNGVDRVDNSVGYIFENCVPACRPCNSIKNGITKEMVEKLYHRLFGDPAQAQVSLRSAAVR